MATLIVDRALELRLQAERAATGADRYDEVWESTYMMAPMPNDEHQQIVSRLASIFQDIIDWPGHGHVRPGVNISDRIDGWQQNYRVPDVAVFLNDGRAENHEAFWYGGPDFAVEVTSPDDQTAEKLPFYARVKVRELLIVERTPWQLVLLSLDGDQLHRIGQSVPTQSETLISAVLPFRFAMVPGDRRPHIRVWHSESDKEWLV
jgi:Uma2 family endonuclease